VRLVEERAIELAPLVSHVFALRDHARAFDAFARRDGLKTLFDPRLS
jgi:threonine dehydrogenase-like Zn-dependent dehydrogenase